MTYQKSRNLELRNQVDTLEELRTQEAQNYQDRVVTEERLRKEAEKKVYEQSILITDLKKERQDLFQREASATDRISELERKLSNMEKLLEGNKEYSEVKTLVGQLSKILLGTSSQSFSADQRTLLKDIFGEAVEPCSN